MAIIPRMKIRTALLMTLTIAFAAAACAQPTPATPPSAQPQQQSNEPGMANVRQGQQLVRDGKLDDALKLFEQAMQQNPSLYAAHANAGSTLDLAGRYAEARQHLQKAIDVANPQQKPGALRS